MGDSRLGAAFFNGPGGCSRCHSAAGDLAKIGAKFPQIATLKARFLWPSSPAPVKVIVTSRAGETVAGTIKSITDFDIALIDLNGTYRYFRRAEVTMAIEDRLAGHRALLPTYSDADISNLAAYLVTLK
jgi:cytochrome c553